MNLTIARITLRSMLGSRRTLLLSSLPAVLLLLAFALRLFDGADLDAAVSVLSLFALGTLLPLVALIAGTGVIGPEIDDGRIVHLLTKPVARSVITTTKLAVAIALVAAFAALPTVAAGLIMVGTTAEVAVAYGIGALLGGVAYCAVFVTLAVVSRNAVTIGLLYALVWESLVGNFAPGTRNLSIQQWSLSVIEELTSATAVEADVSLGAGAVLLALVTGLGAVLAATRLSSLNVAGAD